MFRHDETCLAQRRCLTHHLHETSVVPILSARVPRTATLFQVQKGSGYKRSARGRVLPSSVIEVRAILPSPYCTELASLKLQRFRFLPCAGYLGRLFSKLEAYTSITSLACHIAITKKGTCQEKR